MIIIAGPDVPAEGPISSLEIRDLTPTVLALFGLEIPADLQGHTIGPVVERAAVLS